MRIAIIGSGWVGCHLAKEWAVDHDISIFEKEPLLFSKTSLHSQNRLHLGYHYCRDERTRVLCYQTFSRFMKQYSKFTRTIDNNFYCISNDSAVSTEEFNILFNNHLITQVKNPIQNVDSTYSVKERYIDAHQLQAYFNQTLKHKVQVVNQEIFDYSELKDFDYILDCSNNYLDPQPDSYFEHSVTWTYTLKKPLPWGAITVIDGLFFSIFPYKNHYSLSHVKYSSIDQQENPNHFTSYLAKYAENRLKAELEVKEYFPEFDDYLQYSDYYVGVKAKPKFEKTADRYPRVLRHNNIFKCFTGKVQGIYPIQDEIEGIIL